MKFVRKMDRSIFPIGYPVKGSFNLGEIVPLGAPIEVLPGEEYKINMQSIIRMATPIAPIMDTLDYEIAAFFVPLRLVGSKSTGDVTSPGGQINAAITFEKIIGNGTGNPIDWMQTSLEVYQAPVATWNGNSARSQAYTTVGEAMGLGLGMGTSKTQNLLAFPLYGYNLIYQEHYRNENVEAAKSYLDRGSNVYGYSSSASGNSLDDKTDYNQALSVAYKHLDYITEGLPAPEKGPSVNLPLGTKAPVMADTSDHGMDNPIHFSASTNSLVPSNWYSLGIRSDATNGGLLGIDNNAGSGQEFNVWRSNLITDLQNATAATVNQFIEAYNIQQLLMNDIKGTRYFEVVQAHFGIKNEDLTMYRPEILSIKRGLIDMRTVVQQSGSAAATSATDQGNYLGTVGGFSETHDNTDLVNKAFGEFGYIYIMMVIRQKNTYGQGIPKMFLRSTRFDFFFPELGRIGYDKIDKVEINADETPGSAFAYHPAWQELRTKGYGGQVFGFLNPAKNNSLDYWTLAENRSSTPTLSIAYLKQDRTNLARALTIGSTGPDFIIDSWIYGKFSTLVPIANKPKLFD